MNRHTSHHRRRAWGRGLLSVFALAGCASNPDGVPQGEAADDLAATASGDACQGKRAGNYCGGSLGLNPDARYTCDGSHGPRQLEQCAEGCNPNGAACFHANCTGQANGAYCGDDALGGNARILYSCRGGSVASSSRCATPCAIEPAGTADRCAAPPSRIQAAAGDAFAEVRWIPSGSARSGVTVTSSPDGLTAHVGAQAASARVSGLRNGVSYAFVVSEDGGPPSPSSNAVTPSSDANVIADVVHHPQTRNLTCEEAALVMALSHQKITKTENDVLDAIGIDWTRASFDGSGHLHWGDPYTSFVGNPDGLETNLTGYGTYWPNIARAATSFGARVLKAGEQIDPATLYAAVRAGHPAVAWVTGDWKVHTETNVWITDDGRTITWHGAEEHAVTVVGVDAGTVVIDNPLRAAPWERISKSVFESVYATYDHMAVILE